MILYIWVSMSWKSQTELLVIKMLMNPFSSSFGLDNKLCRNIYGIASQKQKHLRDWLCLFNLLIVEVGTQWPPKSNLFSSATN